MEKKQTDTANLSSLLSFFNHTDPTDQCQSKCTYLHVLDQNADNKETIADVLSLIHHDFKVGTDIKHLVVAGDAKTYNHPQILKSQYDEQLSWLIPFPGDWYILNNLQPVIMKVYFDVGLKHLASFAGYRGETLGSLHSCSNFKNTHNLLLQVWESSYLPDV
jgi:hypothetical protein